MAVSDSDELGDDTIAEKGEADGAEDGVLKDEVPWTKDRLCSDVIETPSLAAQLRDAPEELGHLLRFLSRRIAGDEEAEAVAHETEAWITKHLGADYQWPGNVRELEQCVRNVMVRGEYRPPRAAARGVREELAGAILAGSMTADEMLRRYCTLVFAQTGTYQETARRLGIDRRTVKEKVDRTLLEHLTGGVRSPSM